MIPQWKKDRCKWCATNTPKFGDPIEGMWHRDGEWPVACAAPTAKAYIAELESRLAEAAKITAALAPQAEPQAHDPNTCDNTCPICLGPQAPEGK